MEKEILIIAYVLFAVVGFCIGSFLNVVVYRLPEGMSLAKPASHCPKCGKPIKWYDNIPILSFIFLGGKCRNCKAKISARYPVVEGVCGALFLISALLFFETSPTYAVIVALSLATLISVFIIDLEHTYIPDRLTIILAVLGVIAVFFDPKYAWADHLIGLAAGAFFLALYYGSLALLKKEGLGFGDVKLAFALGLLLGWQKAILVILLSSLAACAVIIPIKNSGKKEFPFAPFLAAATAVALLAGNFILDFYVSAFL
ncbi:MAG: prepilin peptidase [Clostridia bacterium]|nr:prepilin peptidase [Clostridia bacterium]